MYFQCTPSLLQMTGSKNLTAHVFTPISKLRVVALGGEPFPRKATFERWMKNAPSSLRVFNIYGITEVSAWASIHEIKNLRPQPPSFNNNIIKGGGWHDWVPVGQPLSKTSLHVWKMGTCLNEEEETNRGELGRLVIGRLKHYSYLFLFWPCFLSNLQGT